MTATSAQFALPVCAVHFTQHWLSWCDDEEGKGKEISSSLTENQCWTLHFWYCWLSQSFPDVVFGEQAAGLFPCWWAPLTVAFSSSVGKATKIFSLNDITSVCFVLLGESQWRKQMTWAQDAVQGLEGNRIWFGKGKMFWLPWWNKQLSMDLLCSRNGTSC